MLPGFHQFRHRISPNLSVHTLGQSFISVFRNETDNVSDITLQRLANTRHDSLVISCAKENEKDLTRYLTMRAGKKDIQERVLSQIKQTYQNRQQSLQTV